MDPRISLDFTKLSIDHSKEWRRSEKYMSVLQGSVVENANRFCLPRDRKLKLIKGLTWDKLGSS